MTDNDGTPIYVFRLADEFGADERAELADILGDALERADIHAEGLFISEGIEPLTKDDLRDILAEVDADD